MQAQCFCRGERILNKRGEQPQEHSVLESTEPTGLPARVCSMWQGCSGLVFQPLRRLHQVGGEGEWEQLTDFPSSNSLAFCLSVDTSYFPTRASAEAKPEKECGAGAYGSTSSACLWLVSPRLSSVGKFLAKGVCINLDFHMTSSTGVGTNCVVSKL